MLHKINCDIPPNTRHLQHLPDFVSWPEIGNNGIIMNLEKIIFGFFIILACTLNFGFFIGEPDNVNGHDAAHLFVAVVVNLIALIMKFGDRTHIGATHQATSLVAMLQLLAASFVWMWHVNITHMAMNGETMSTIVSLSGGALVANIISVILLISETLRQTR